MYTSIKFMSINGKYIPFEIEFCQKEDVDDFLKHPLKINDTINFPHFNNGSELTIKGIKTTFYELEDYKKYRVITYYVE